GRDIGPVHEPVGQPLRIVRQRASRFQMDRAVGTPVDNHFRRTKPYRAHAARFLARCLQTRHVLNGHPDQAAAGRASRDPLAASAGERWIPALAVLGRDDSGAAWLLPLHLRGALLKEILDALLRLVAALR